MAAGPRDNFNDNNLDTGLWSDASTGAGVVSETGGQLTLTPDTAAASHAEVLSVATYDLTNDVCSVQLVQYLNAGTNREALFGLQSDASNRLYWYISSSG